MLLGEAVMAKIRIDDDDFTRDRCESADLFDEPFVQYY